jgi:hypothetical protein
MTFKIGQTVRRVEKDLKYKLFYKLRWCEWFPGVEWLRWEVLFDHNDKRHWYD